MGAAKEQIIRILRTLVTIAIFFVLAAIALIFLNDGPKGTLFPVELNINMAVSEPSDNLTNHPVPVVNATEQRQEFQAEGLSYKLIHAWTLDKAELLDQVGDWDLRVSGNPASGTGRYPQDSRNFFFQAQGQFFSTSEIDMPSIFTFCFWRNTTLNSGYWFRYDPQPENDYFSMHQKDGKLLWQLYNKGYITAETQPPELNSWHFYCFVTNETAIMAYVDGAFVSRAEGLKLTGAQKSILYIGDRHGNSQGGIMDEMYLWQRMLSLSEIAVLWHNGQGTFFPFNSS